MLLELILAASSEFCMVQRSRPRLDSQSHLFPWSGKIHYSTVTLQEPAFASCCREAWELLCLSGGICAAARLTSAA